MARVEHDISILKPMEEEPVTITLNEPIVLSAKDKMYINKYREIYEKRFWLLIYFFMKTYQENIKLIPSWKKTKRSYLCHLLIITENEKDINNNLEKIFNEQEYLVMLNKTVLYLETLLQKEGLNVINKNKEVINCLEFTDLYEYIFERRAYKPTNILEIGSKISTFVTRDIKPIYYITYQDIKEIEKEINLPKEIRVSIIENIKDSSSKILEKDKDFLIKEIERDENRSTCLPRERKRSSYTIQEKRVMNTLRKEDSKLYQEDMFWAIIYLLVSEEGLSIELETIKQEVRPHGIRNIIEIKGKQLPENFMSIMNESKKIFIDKRRSIIVLQLIEIIKNCGWYIELGCNKGRKADYKRRNIKYLQKGKIVLNKKCIQLISEIFNEHKEEYCIGYKYVITPLLIENIKQEINEKLKKIEIDLDIVYPTEEKRDIEEDKSMDEDDSSSTIIETFV